MNKENMTEAEEYDRFLRTFITACSISRNSSIPAPSSAECAVITR